MNGNGKINDEIENRRKTPIHNEYKELETTQLGFHSGLSDRTGLI